MSLGTSQTLSKDSATDVDTNTVVYDLQAADAGQSSFSVAGITPPSAKLMSVSHQTGKSGEARTSRSSRQNRSRRVRGAGHRVHVRGTGAPTKLGLDECHLHRRS